MEMLRLGENCVKIGSGATPKGGKEAYLEHGPFSLIRSQNVRNEGFTYSGLAFISDEQADQLSNVEVRVGDVLLNITGDSVARVCQVDPSVLPARVNQHVAIIRPKPNAISARFLRYYLATHDMQMHMLGLAASGATRNALTKSMIEKFEVPSFPLPEQRAIAATLGALDDKIELNRRMNETLEAMARALFRDWFVDFGPTRAKMADAAPYLAEGLWSLFPDRLDDDGKPEGWEVRTLGDVADQIAMGPFGSNIKVETFVDEGIPVISGAHLRGLQLNDKDYNYVTEAHADKLGRSNVRRGDVVFTHAGNIGQVAIIPETAEFDRYVISQRQFYMRCNLQLMSPLYVVHYFHSPEGKHTLLANSSQVGVPSIARPATYLKSIEICCPPKPLLDEFDRVVSTIHLKVGKNQRETRTLAETRDLLLPRLMSGELRVAGVDPVLEKVL